MNLRHRLAALEKGYVTEPTILTMPNDTRYYLTGRADLLVFLLPSEPHRWFSHGGLGKLLQLSRVHMPCARELNVVLARTTVFHHPARN